MTVVLTSPLWAANTRIQRAANNNPPMRTHDSDTTAVTLLQTGMIQSGFALEKGADGNFGPKTAATIVTIQKFFGFKPDSGVAGREVLGSLDLMLRGYDPPPGPHWGGLLAATNLNLASQKIRAAQEVLEAVRTLLQRRVSITTVGSVTLDALKTHFKLVPSGSTKLAREEFITIATINPLISNFGGMLRTLLNPKMIRHSICTGGNEPVGLFTAAEAPFGGPVTFGPPFSDFTFDPDTIGNNTNIIATGRNSLAAIMMHEAMHVVDIHSGFTESDARTTHISEFDGAYETQAARFARHNPSAFATFAAHIVDLGDRLPPNRRFGQGTGGRPF